MSDEEIYVLKSSLEFEKPSMLVKAIDRIENEKGYVKKLIVEPLDLPGFKKELEGEDLKLLEMGTLFNVFNMIKDTNYCNKWTILDYFNNPLFHGNIDDILDIFSDMWFASMVVSLDITEGVLKLNIGLSMYNEGGKQRCV